MFPVHLGDGHNHVNQLGKSYGPREQANDDQNAAEKLRARGKIGRPPGQANAAEELFHIVNAGHFGIAVNNHHRTQRNAHGQQAEGLQLIQESHSFSPMKSTAEYAEDAEAIGNKNRLRSKRIYTLDTSYPDPDSSAFFASSAVFISSGLSEFLARRWRRRHRSDRLRDAFPSRKGTAPGSACDSAPSPAAGAW